ATGGLNGRALRGRGRGRVRLGDGRTNAGDLRAELNEHFAEGRAPLEGDPRLLAQRVEGELRARQSSDEIDDGAAGGHEGRELVEMTRELGVARSLVEA